MVLPLVTRVSHRRMMIFGTMLAVMGLVNLVSAAASGVEGGSDIVGRQMTVLGLGAIVAGLYGLAVSLGTVIVSEWVTAKIRHATSGAAGIPDPARPQAARATRTGRLPLVFAQAFGKLFNHDLCEICNTDDRHLGDKDLTSPRQV